MIKKLFCACIYLYQGSAVRNLQDHTVVDNDAAWLAAYYCNNNADRIIVFDDGKIDGVGTHEELLKNNSIYREVYNQQMNDNADFDKKGGEQ